MTKRLSTLLLALALVLAGPGAGGGVPSFALKKLDGSTFRIEDHAGKQVIVAVFWATWCEPCHNILMKLQKLRNRFPDVLVLAISIDDGRSLATVNQYVQGRGFTFNVLLDSDTNVMRMFNPSLGVPYMVVIGRDQRIAYHRMGYLPGDEHALFAKVAELR